MIRNSDQVSPKNTQTRESAHKKSRRIAESLTDQGQKKNR